MTDRSTVAVALEGLWGFRQIDKSGVSLWKIYFLQLALCLLLMLAYLPITSLVNPDTFLSDYYTFEVLMASFAANALLAGFGAFCIFALARTTESDIRRLAENGADLSSAVALLKPRPVAMFTAALIFVFVLMMFSPIIQANRWDISIASAIGYQLEVGIAPAVLFLLMPLLVGTVGGISLVIIVGQMRALLVVARTIRIDLMSLHTYPPIAAPLMRLVIIVLVFTSGLPLTGLMTSSEAFTDGVVLVGLLMAIFYTPLLAGYFAPVWVLRNRIRDLKQEALAAIHVSRSEGEATTHESRFGLPASDLLTQQMFVESRWEWPVSAHVQKLLLFGMLPPFTWIMAAIVENLLF